MSSGRFSTLCVWLGLLLISFVSASAESPSTEIDGPTDFNPGKFERRTKNWIGGETASRIRWAVPLGNTTYCRAVLSDELVLIASNNGNAYLDKFPENVDLGCLLAFDRKTGAFQWQYSAEKLENSDYDWPQQGLCSNPAVDNVQKLVWFVNNRSEVVCLSLDSKNVVDSEPKVVWSFDMTRELGVLPHQMPCCDPKIVGDRLFTGTSNGVAMNDRDVSSPKSPNLIALDQTTGEKIWSDVDLYLDQVPDSQILDGQWSSPALIAADESIPFDQIVYPRGDGWVYSYRIENQTILPFWKFDANPKTALWKGNGLGTRNIVMSTPIYSKETGALYITTGQDPESGEGSAVFWAIDLKKAVQLASDADRSFDEAVDVSETLVVDSESQPVAPERYLACDVKKGQREIPNQNSAVAWKYLGTDPESDEFESVFHRTLGTPVVANGMIFVGDFSGLIHCLDAKTGECFWVYDSMATIWASPVAVGDVVYLGNSDGDLLLFDAATSEQNLVETINMGAPIYAAPTFDAENQTLFIPTSRYLFAVDACPE